MTHDVTASERAAAMSLADKIKLFSELAPLIVIIQQIAVAADDRQRALLILDALQFLAGKTRTTDDDEALELLENVLKSNEGTALFAWVLKKFEAKA
jgi:hypothetical protein